jgi:hypothetical protein
MRRGYLVNAEDGGGSVGGKLDRRGLASQEIQNVSLGGVDRATSLLITYHRE